MLLAFLPNKPRFRRATLPSAVSNAGQHYIIVVRILCQPPPGLGGLKKSQFQHPLHARPSTPVSRYRSKRHACTLGGLLTIPPVPAKSANKCVRGRIQVVVRHRSVLSATLWHKYLSVNFHQHRPPGGSQLHLTALSAGVRIVQTSPTPNSNSNLQLQRKRFRQYTRPYCGRENGKRTWECVVLCNIMEAACCQTAVVLMAS